MTRRIVLEDLAFAGRGRAHVGATTTPDKALSATPWARPAVTRFSQRTELLIHEAALVLQQTARAVINTVRRGEVRDVAAGRIRRLDARQVAQLIADRPLALEVLTAILEGRLRAPRRGLDESPPSLMECWRSLW